MTTDPLAWIEPFVEAGADGVIFCFDSLKDPAAAIKQVKDLGKFVGISLLVTEPVSVLEPYWNLIDQVTIVGTPMGTKGTSMEPSIFDKIREARAAIEKHGAKVEIQLDGGIRRNTVPQINEAGGDWIVPGSLMFGEDPAAMRRGSLDFRAPNELLSKYGCENDGKTGLAAGTDGGQRAVVLPHLTVLLGSVVVD